jgi:hypothetical protein
MLPPFEYKKARILARFHVQVELDSVPDIALTPGEVRVGGRVNRVFRGDPDLRCCDPVEFAVSVYRQQDDLPVGGICWTNFDALRGARFMEVYLTGKPPNCSVARWQSKIIEKPCDTPALPCTPADSLDELVGVLADGCFQGRSVRARICNHPGEASAMLFEKALCSMDAAPMEHQNTSEDKGAGNCQFRIGDAILTVCRDASAIDVEGPPAVVLRVMYAVCGIPITKDTGSIHWRKVMPKPEAIMESVDPLQTSLAYANILAEGGENDGALFMLDLAIPGLDQLALKEGRHDLLESFVAALVTKGIVISRLGHDATAHALFQRANELMTDADRDRNAAYRWLVKYLDLAEKEGRASQHRSAAGLFGQAVALLEQLVNRGGRVDLRGQLAQALVRQANALTKLGQDAAAVQLCDRVITILEPMVQIQKRRAFEPDLATAKGLKHRARLGSPPQTMQ